MLKDLLRKSNTETFLSDKLINSWESYLEVTTFKDFTFLETKKIERILKRNILEVLTINDIPPNLHFPIMRINGFKSFSDDASGIEFIRIPNNNLNGVYEKLISK